MVTSCPTDVSAGREDASRFRDHRGDFADCLDSDRFADVISANMRLGTELGVTGTPTIFVSKGDGRSVRVSRWNEFEAIKSVVDRMVEEAEVAAN